MRELCWVVIGMQVYELEAWAIILVFVVGCIVGGLASFLGQRCLMQLRQQRQERVVHDDEHIYACRHVHRRVYRHMHTPVPTGVHRHVCGHVCWHVYKHVCRHV